MHKRTALVVCHRDGRRDRDERADRLGGFAITPQRMGSWAQGGDREGGKKWPDPGYNLKSGAECSHEFPERPLIKWCFSLATTAARGPAGRRWRVSDRLALSRARAKTLVRQENWESARGSPRPVAGGANHPITSAVSVCKNYIRPTNSAVMETDPVHSRPNPPASALAGRAGQHSPRRCLWPSGSSSCEAR